MITKVVTILIALLFLATFAIAQEPEEIEDLQELEEIEDPLELKGTVTSLVGDALTITSDGEEWTFVVDKDTRVIAKGGGHKQEESMKYDKPNLLKDLVKQKDLVIVTYEFSGTGKLRAQTVRVL